MVASRAGHFFKERDIIYVEDIPAQNVCGKFHESRLRQGLRESFSSLVASTVSNMIENVLNGPVLSPYSPKHSPELFAGKEPVRGAVGGVISGGTAKDAKCRSSSLPRDSTKESTKESATHRAQDDADGSAKRLAKPFMFIAVAEEEAQAEERDHRRFIEEQRARLERRRFEWEQQRKAREDMMHTRFTEMMKVEEDARAGLRAKAESKPSPELYKDSILLTHDRFQQDRIRALREPAAARSTSLPRSRSRSRSNSRSRSVDAKKTSVYGRSYCFQVR